MAGLSDRRYATVCGRLARHLGVSIAAARRRVEILASREGVRDLQGRLALAERLLEETIAEGGDPGSLLTDHLRALASEADFMSED